MADTLAQAALRAAFGVKVSLTPQTLTPDQQQQARTNIGAISSNDLNQQVKNAVLSMFFPVGSIYLSASDSFNPNDSWGGTWEKIEDRFLFGSGTNSVGSTGGEENVTLTLDQIPSHSHTGSTNSASVQVYTPFSFAVISGNPYAGLVPIYDDTGHAAASDSAQYTAGGKTSNSASHSHTLSIGNSGGGLPHDNMPPYLVVSIWQRTA